MRTVFRMQKFDFALAKRAPCFFFEGVLLGTWARWQRRILVDEEYCIKAAPCSSLENHFLDFLHWSNYTCFNLSLFLQVCRHGCFKGRPWFLPGGVPVRLFCVGSRASSCATSSDNVVGTSGEDCMKKINAGEVQFGVFDGSFIDQAATTYSLKPIRTEGSSAGTDNQYYAVGIVKKSASPGKLADLKGKRSCHSGYGRIAGWTLPIATMVDANNIPTVSQTTQANDIESVTSFFETTCAASNTAATSVCSGCKTTTGCTTADAYYDYQGAFRAVVEGACDVAFTKFTIPAEYSLGGPKAQSDWTGLEAPSAYALLCPGATSGPVCGDISSYATCNFGSAPPHTIMTSGTYPQAEINAFNAVMDLANSNAEFHNLFFSGKNTEGFIFSSDATKTLAYNGTATALTSSINGAKATIKKANDTPTNANGAASIANGGALAIASVVVSLWMLC